MDLISLDKSRCTQCGKCIRMMEGYCITEVDGYPSFDTTLCNTCQKCVAICPSQAIMVNSTHAERITTEADLTPEQLHSLYQLRRSTKRFRDEPIPKDVLADIATVGKYAPNQNKNLSILLIDDLDLIAEIDVAGLKFVRTWYNLMFGFPPVHWFIRAFYPDIDTIKRKMERDLVQRKHVIKDNTQAFVVVMGNKRIAVTESSAHYMLGTVLYMAEAHGVDTCLMDSIVTTLNLNKPLRRKLNITENVLGVMALGYSAENVVNIPRGYEVPTHWNVIESDPTGYV